MNISTNVITYPDLFNDSNQDVNHLLKNIDSDILIQVMCYINSYLFPYNDDDVTVKQKEIFQKFFRRLPNGTRYKLEVLIENKKILFLRSSILEFVQYVFMNYHIIHEFEDTTPEHELNLLKAYLLISDKKQDKSFNLKKNDKKQELFYTFFWPFLAQQFDLNKIEHPIFPLLKGAIYLSYFKNNEKYNSYYNEFLDKSGCKTGWEYIHKLILLSKNGYENEPVAQVGTDYTNPFFKNSIFNHDEFLKAEHLRKNFNGFKARPIYKANNNQLYIIDWDFLNRKFFDGLIRDFYEVTSIHQIIKKFPDFLATFSKDISEDILFRKTIEACFKNRFNEILFNRFPEKCPADCYLRYNQYIFLFEFKNNSFSSKSLDAGSFDSIKEEIDRKMNFTYNWEDNTKNKGVAQIINQIKQLHESFESQNKLSRDKIKFRNMVIIPIVVYSDKVFGMPGINDYLNSEFLKYQSTLGDLNFKKIEDLTLININFFIQNLDAFRSGNIRLFMDLITDYRSKIKKRKQNHKSNPDIKKYDQLFDSFEDIEFYSNPDFFRNNSGGFAKRAIEIFAIDIF